jgi:hypothetical protein
MSTEITLFSGMIFRVDKDSVVRAGCHTRFAADADRLVEIDNAVRAFEHRTGGTSGDAGRVRALIATSDLMRATRLRKLTNINMLDVSSGNRKRYQVL